MSSGRRAPCPLDRKNRTWALDCAQLTWVRRWRDPRLAVRSQAARHRRHPNGFRPNVDFVLAVTSHGETKADPAGHAVQQGGRRDGCFGRLSSGSRQGLAANAAGLAVRSSSRANRPRRRADKTLGSMPPVLRIGRGATRVDPPAGKRDRASLAMRALRIRVGHRVSTAVGLGGSRTSRFGIGGTSGPGAPVDSVVDRIHLSDSRFAARTIRRSMIASRPKHNPGLGETAWHASQSWTAPT